MLSYIKAQNSSLRLSPIFQRILRSGFVPDILKSVVKNVFIRIFAYGGICHTDGRRKRRMNGCAGGKTDTVADRLCRGCHRYSSWNAGCEARMLRIFAGVPEKELQTSC